MNYHVADFVTRIKNAYAAHRKDVVMPYSNISFAIAKTLVKQKFLAEVKTDEVEGKKVIKASLRYSRRKPVVSEVKIISKPSLRVYVSALENSKTSGREAMTSVLSTSQGIMTGREAHKKGVGGELLFKIW